MKAGFSLAAAATGIRTFTACAHPPTKPAIDQYQDVLKDIRIIDAHSHPDQFFKNAPINDPTSTLAAIKALGMTASSFSVVGDRSNPYGTPLSFYQSAKVQLERVQSLSNSGQVKLVLKDWG